MNAMSSPSSLRIIMVIFLFFQFLVYFFGLDLYLDIRSSPQISNYPWLSAQIYEYVPRKFIKRSEYWVRLVDYECTSLQLLGNKLPQNLWLQMTHIDYLVLSMHQELKAGTVGSSTHGLTNCNVGVNQDAFSFRELIGKELLPSSFRFFGRIYFLVAILMRTLVFTSCWLKIPLDTRGHTQFLKVTGSFLPCGLLQHSLLFRQVHKFTSSSLLRQNLIWHNLIIRMNPIIFAIFDWLGISHRSQQHLRGENYTKTWIPGCGTSWRST